MTSSRQIIGWREHAALPDLDISDIVFKTDTGAKTSSLHALDITLFKHTGEQWVRFRTTLRGQPNDNTIVCEAKVIEFRNVTNSGGETQVRPVIKTCMKLGTLDKNIELTLNDRSNMRYKMLLGRRAMRKTFVVDPAKSFLIEQNNFCSKSTKT